MCARLHVGYVDGVSQCFFVGVEKSKPHQTRARRKEEGERETPCDDRSCTIECLAVHMYIHTVGAPQGGRRLRFLRVSDQVFKAAAAHCLNPSCPFPILIRHSPALSICVTSLSSCSSDAEFKSMSALYVAPPPVKV